MTDPRSLGGLHLFRVATPEKFIATKWPVMTSANSVSRSVGQAGRDEQVVKDQETDWKIGENDPHFAVVGYIL